MLRIRSVTTTAANVHETPGLSNGCTGKKNAYGENDCFQRNMLSVMAKHLAGVKRKGVVGAMRGASLSDLPPQNELEQLTMPVLILAWPDDETHPLAVAEKLHDILPNSQLEVIEQADDPYQWPQLVREFVTSLN